jgi:hypothetical protein
MARHRAARRAFLISQATLLLLRSAILATRPGGGVLCQTVANQLKKHARWRHSRRRWFLNPHSRLRCTVEVPVEPV